MTKEKQRQQIKVLCGLFLSQQLIGPWVNHLTDANQTLIISEINLWSMITKMTMLKPTRFECLNDANDANAKS